MQFSLRRGVAVAAASFIAACGGGSNETSSADVESAQIEDNTLPASVARLARGGAEGVKSRDRRLSHVSGQVEVWVSLEAPSVAAFKSERLKAQEAETQGRSFAMSAEARSSALAAETRGQRSRLLAQQDDLAGRLASLGTRELGRVQIAHNAIAIQVDSSRLQEIGAMAGVTKVRPVGRYALAETDSVAHVGAAVTQASGFDGRGVRVAVLDSGIDYTHASLGGAGTSAAFQAAYGSVTTTDGLFPTAKVVGGYDFVGESWPDYGERSEDPDPIDVEGHGTHVADIIAGRSPDGRHTGVAPGASLLAVKVCSAVASACDGVAMLKGIDFALDPNGDGDTSDAVDVINLSLGSAYGQYEDDLSDAAADAVKLGVVVVAAAGNNGNLPFVVGAPSTTPGVISVAETETPSARAYPLRVDAPAKIAATYANTQVVEFAPVGAGFNGAVVYVGQGCPADGAISEDRYKANPAGKIALIDRGTCPVSVKVDRAARAGAKGVIIAMVAPGDPLSFDADGGNTFVPTVVVPQNVAIKMKGQTSGSVVVTLDGSGRSLIGSVVGTSARGPGIPSAGIKPEIGAPGALYSAQAGTGNLSNTFSGTSGAVPMVAGAAAVLLQAHPTRTPEQIKAMLMNSAEPKVYTNSVSRSGVLAPVSRVGSGELRVNRALALNSVARESASKSASLSFGFPSVTQTANLKRRLLVENFSARAKVYTIKTSYRTVGAGTKGAVRVYAPSSVSVAARSRAEIEVRLVIDGERLPDWTLDGGPNGGNGALLDQHEYDGFVTLTAGSETMSVPWHVLPRKASAFAAIPTTVSAGQSVRLSNFGVANGKFDVFSLTGVSAKAPRSDLPKAGDNFAFIDLRAIGVRLVRGKTAARDQVQFAINTYGRRMHPNYPAEFDIGIDSNRDGIDDYTIFNNELDGFGASGQNIINVLNVATQETTSYSFIDADLNSANVIVTVPRSALGLSRDQAFDFKLNAFDNYFSGQLSDQFGVMTYTLGQPRYLAKGLPANNEIAPFSAIRVGTSAPAGGKAASPSQSGLLFMYRHDAGLEADTVTFR